MIIGVFLAIVLFAPLSYLITRLCVRYGYGTGNRWMTLPAVFIGMLVGLSIFSFAMLAAGSIFGISIAVASDAVATTADLVQPGYISALGVFLLGFLALLGAFAGPAAAFVAAKMTTIICLIFVIANADEEVGKTWIPLAGAVAGGVSMWPFATFLTFGL